MSAEMGTCGHYLRTGNDGPMCSPCTEAAERRAAEPVEDVPTESAEHIPMTKAGTLTARILDALPGTAAEVAKRVGHDERRTAILLSALARDGRATSDGGHGRGRHRRARAVYMLPSSQVEAA